MRDSRRNSGMELTGSVDFVGCFPEKRFDSMSFFK